MKKLLAAFATIALLCSAAPLMRGQDVSVNFFYDNLNDGSWFEVGDYGYCWQPDVAVNDSTWRPYADGYWAYTEDGWTWVSYEDFGWATYHYGRWVKLADYGWVWKPGYEWGPAWVSWRTGGNYIGWAPLPPETETVYESRPLTGHLDVEFDIGPAYYNFCDVRYIGEPVLRSRLVPYQQNVTYITQTVNVTNITYKNKTVYNYGPDINVVNQYSSRPVQRLKLERQANVDVSSAAKSGSLTKVQGNALLVAAPTKLNKPSQEIAPPKVKAKVAQPKVEKGWAEVGDANAQTQLKEKIKTQDINKVPPPTLGNAPKASAAPSAGSGAEASPFEKGKGKNKNRNKTPDQLQTGSPAGAEMSPGMSPANPEGKKKKNKHLNQPDAMTSPSTATGPEMSPAGPGAGKKKGKHGEQNQPGAITSPSAATGAEMSPGAMPETGKPGKGKNRRGDQFGTPSPAGQMPEGSAPSEMKQKEKAKNFGAAGGGTTPQSVSDEPGNDEGARKRKADQLEKAQRREPGAPLNSRSGAAGAPSTNTNAIPPQSEPAVGGEKRGKNRVEPANPPGVAEPRDTNRPGNPERKREGKNKPADTPVPTPQ